jgi:surface polysaccharide O-acyltransferase-like enzyme
LHFQGSLSAAKLLVAGESAEFRISLCLQRNFHKFFIGCFGKNLEGMWLVKIFSYVDEADSHGFHVPVDLVRAFAIFCVVLLHAAIESYDQSVMTDPIIALYNGTTSAYQSVAIVGVPLFAILSGALLLRPSKTFEPIRVFLMKRLGRLGLAFAFWSAVYFAWSFLVDAQPFSWQAIVGGVFSNGAYFHFWFFYLIGGLYLATPVLRIIVDKGGRIVTRYLLVLWFVGTSVMPLVLLVSGVLLGTGFALNNMLFLFTGFIGYFVFGAYVTRIRASSRILIAGLLMGIAWTLIGTYFMIYPLNWVGQYYFFFDTVSANVVLLSISIYMLLSKAPADWPGKTKHSRLHAIVHFISANTLPIYLFHVMILESIHRGYFGFKLSLVSMNPIVEIPLAAAIAFVITIALIWLMTRFPILTKLIGSASF